MDFKESLKKLRSMSDDEVVAMVEKATGKALVSYEGLDALIAALMGFYNGELKKKSPTGHKHAKEDITNFPSSMPPTAHTHDDRYDTKGEINNKLSTKVNTSDIVDNLTDSSQNKALSARQGKILNDNKSNKADEWRLRYKEIGSTNTSTDLNTILEVGNYRSISAENKLTNLPSGCSSAFVLTVTSITDLGGDYTRPWFSKTQIIKSHESNNTWIRTIISSESNSYWGPWQQIALVEKITAINGKGKIQALTGTNLPPVRGLITGEVYNNGYPTYYGNLIQIKGTGSSELLLGWSGDNGQHAENYIRSKRDKPDAPWSGWAKIWTDANFNPNLKLNTGSLPTKVGDAKGLYDLIENNSGLNFDPNLLFLNDAGTKYVNKIYFDRNKKGMFKCIAQTTATTNSTSYFVDISNNANSDQLRNLRSLGLNQSWKNITSSRKYDTIYTNNTSFPIAVNISIPINNWYVVELVVDNIVVSHASKKIEGLVGNTLYAIVPPKSTYKLNGVDGTPNFIWAELS